MTPDSSVTDVAARVALTAEPFCEDNDSESSLPITRDERDAAPLSPILEEPPVHTYPESGLISFAVDEVTTQGELSGPVPEPLPDLSSQSTEDPFSAASSQVREFEAEELGSTSPPEESLIDTNGRIEAEAPAFHDASVVSNTDLRQGSPSMDDGATEQDDLAVSIPAPSSPSPELPASTMELPPPQPDLLVPVQERQPEAPSHVVEVEVGVVSDSPSSEPALLPADINPAEAEPLPPVVPVALPTTAISASDVNLKEDSESIKSKSDRSKATAVGKKAFKSLKGVFGSSKSKAAGSGLTSPSTDTLASVESQGKASINSAIETASINGAANPNKGASDFSSSQESLVPNKTALSVAKGGVKRLFGSKDKANVSSPSLESVETQRSDTTLTPTAPGLGLKKKQRQQTIDSASPMLKGMFKGRNPLRKPTA